MHACACSKTLSFPASVIETLICLCEEAGATGKHDSWCVHGCPWTFSRCALRWCYGCTLYTHGLKCTGQCCSHATEPPHQLKLSHKLAFVTAFQSQYSWTRDYRTHGMIFFEHFNTL